MDGVRRGESIVVEDARQRLYDSRGYGRPLDGDMVELDPVEAAFLLYRGDLTTVDGDGFTTFMESQTGQFTTYFLVYADLRSRGFYLSPERDRTADHDFVVYPRGSGPADDEIAYRVRAIGEGLSVTPTELGHHVLAVVDEEGEVTYLATSHGSIDGSTQFDPPACSGVLLADRVVIWSPPAALYRDGFYGQPLVGRTADDAALQLSLIEAAYLARLDVLSIDAGTEAVIDHGRSMEGNHFDRRLAVYTALREQHAVPKTGFKFGADFRVYTAVESVDALGHSDYLVRVADPTQPFTPRELALDVRLAGGVRKQLVFAAVGDEIDWVMVNRLTP